MRQINLLPRENGKAAVGSPRKQQRWSRSVIACLAMRPCHLRIRDNTGPSFQSNMGLDVSGGWWVMEGFITKKMRLVG